LGRVAMLRVAFVGVLCVRHVGLLQTTVGVYKAHGG
jgi:hypothetical protein